jgi:plasmid stabilization system protein ParE
VKLRVSGRARAKIRREDEWWRRERPAAPDLFKEELAVAFDRILKAPKARKPYATIEHEPVWRLLMPRTEHHVYYRVDEIAAEVIVEAVWGARKGREPRL